MDIRGNSFHSKEGARRTSQNIVYFIIIIIIGSVIVGVIVIVIVSTIKVRSDLGETGAKRTSGYV